MSYGLTFYLGSYEQLRDEILNPSEGFLEKLQDKWKNLYAPSAGETFEDALKEGLVELKKAVSANTKTKLSIKGELALVGAIQSEGKELGTLVHSSAGGDQFREDFLNGAAAGIFNLPGFGDYLTKRPVFGISTLEYPSWGYLLHNQILELEGNDNQPTIANKKDFDEWFVDLRRFIKQAKDAGSDLLTIYR